MAPALGSYGEIEGVVPTVRGNIRIKATANQVEVCSDLDGGILLWKGAKYPIPQGQSLIVEG